MTDRLAWILLGGGLLGLGGCARVVAPTGGPLDTVAPRLVASLPESSAVNVSRQEPLALQFSEWINPNTARSVITLTPAPSRSPEIRVKGPIVQVRLREPLDSATTYVLQVGKGLSDWRDAKTDTVRRIAFSTGSQLDTGSLVVRVWNGSDSVAPTVGAARIGIWPLESARRAGLARLLRNRDSVAWLDQTPRVWREKPWRWVWSDSTGRATLTHLPAGQWRVQAWNDLDKDGFWRPGEEALSEPALLDWKARSARDSFCLRLAAADTVVRPAVVPEVKDSSQPAKDSLRIVDSLALDSLHLRDAKLPADSTVELILDRATLPTIWQNRTDLMVRFWSLSQRRRPVVVALSDKHLRLRLPAGTWRGEIWSDANNTRRPRTSPVLSDTQPLVWRPLALVTLKLGDAPTPLTLEPIGSVGLPSPATESGDTP